MREGFGLPSFFVEKNSLNDLLNLSWLVVIKGSFLFHRYYEPMAHKLFSVNILDTIVNTIGIIYGLVLILTNFVRHKATEPFRIDALLMPHPTESTRPLNLVVGILVAGYAIYSLLPK